MTVLTLTADTPFETCASTFRLSTDNGAEPNDELSQFVTFGLRTGACHIQTYITAKQCRTLAAQLMLLAPEVEPIPVGEATELAGKEFA